MQAADVLNSVHAQGYFETKLLLDPLLRLYHLTGRIVTSCTGHSLGVGDGLGHIWVPFQAPAFCWSFVLGV